MNQGVSSIVRLLVVVGLILTISGCATQPRVAADATEKCPWPYGCDVRPESVQKFAKIEGRATLPADTFTLGPPSGSELGKEINGRRLPFEDQPVQGFSSVLDADGIDNTYWVITDNGFGTKAISADFLLRMYRIRAEFGSGRGGSGNVSVEEYIRLRDPERHIPFRITNEYTKDRLLTGADFDPESVQRDRAGDLWFGDEYGPFLLHTDATGQVLDAPFPQPDVRSPQNSYSLSPRVANLPASQGFEGMAISEDGKFLYPALGGALTYDLDQRRRFIYEFDLQRKRYTGERWQYHADKPENTVSDLSPVTGDSRNRLLLVERTTAETKGPQFVRVYLVDLHKVDDSGFLIKRRVLELPEPQVESIILIDDRKILVITDNDYPFTTNDTQAIVVRLEGRL